MTQSTKSFIELNIPVSNSLNTPCNSLTHDVERQETDKKRLEIDSYWLLQILQANQCYLQPHKILFNLIITFKLEKIAYTLSTNGNFSAFNCA